MGKFQAKFSIKRFFRYFRLIFSHVVLYSFGLLLLATSWSVLAEAWCTVSGFGIKLESLDVYELYLECFLSGGLCSLFFYAVADTFYHFFLLGLDWKKVTRILRRFALSSLESNNEDSYS